METQATNSEQSPLFAGMQTAARTDAHGNAKDFSQPALPTLALPQGGGSYAGMGEKFNVNPVTGTASLSAPLAISPGRDGFTPELSLTYDSGAGNGIFGMGWRLSLPTITRKTSKGLPRYDDGADSDIFVLADAEDIIPALEQQPNGAWIKIERIDGDYYVRRYRPRIESAYSLIERWTHRTTGSSFWQLTSKQGIISVFGKTENECISHPDDPAKVFSWLLSEVRDGKGNRMVYEYRREDLANVDLGLPYENHRAQLTALANRYPHAVTYGNYGEDDDTWAFHILFDYGDYDESAPSAYTPVSQWQTRRDPFSDYRAGFERRTYRLCRRILMFHHFAELGPEPCLVRSTDFAYNEHERLTTLSNIRHTGYIKEQQGYHKQSLPALSFSYSQVGSNGPVASIDAQSLENLPTGAGEPHYQWTDLYGEGLNGVFTEQAGEWYYKANLGDGVFAAQEKVAQRPSFGTVPQLVDIDLDGNKELLLLEHNGISGYYKSGEEGWQPLQTFANLPTLDWKNPNMRLVDLNGDGRPDILITEDEILRWRPSLGTQGYGAEQTTTMAEDEGEGPRLVFDDGTQSMYLADMSGDGLSDLVRIRNGEVCYWPNLGYAKFGAKVCMAHAPQFDYPELFEQRRLRIGDIDGAGAADLIYVGREDVRIWRNQAGNSWSAAQTVEGLPLIDNLASVQIADVLGVGAACLTWSTPLPDAAGNHMRYVDLSGGVKPHLLHAIDNNMGAQTVIRYTSSTKFYLAAKASGRPWATKLSFPVQVVESTEVIDQISASRYTTRYAYHHGYYDPDEREFRGFGLVEQWDSETFEEHPGASGIERQHYSPPAYSKTWYHTGACFQYTGISRRYREEYYQGDTNAWPFPESVVTDADAMDASTLREAYRALKGLPLRQEIYAQDGSADASHPYSVTETNYRAKLIQEKSKNPFAVFTALPVETLSYQYERNPIDPRITHQAVLTRDEYGYPLQTCQIAYPRRLTSNNAPYEEQRSLKITVSESDVINATEDMYLLGMPYQSRTFEILNAQLAEGHHFDIGDIKALVNAALSDIISHDAINPGDRFIARLLSWEREYYQGRQGEILPLGVTDAIPLPRHTESALGTVDFFADVFGADINDQMLYDKGRYLLKDGYWHSQSSTVVFDANAFYQPVQSIDPFGNHSSIEYDTYGILAVASQDAYENRAEATIDYRTLSPSKIIDINGNVTKILTDAVGMVIATSAYGSENGQERGDAPLNDFQPLSPPGLDDLLTEPHRYLQQATTFFHYDPHAWAQRGEPAIAAGIARETHNGELRDRETTRVQISLAFSDGFGRTLQEKTNVEPGIAIAMDSNGAVHSIRTDTRWLVSGRTVYNNKGQPIKQYEPLYSAHGGFEPREALLEIGVTPVFHYDPLQRLVKTVTPKGFFSEIRFTPWESQAFDENDTVMRSEFYLQRFNDSQLENDEREALVKALLHAETPQVSVMDNLGRVFLKIKQREAGGERLVSHTELDISGNTRRICDPRFAKLNLTNNDKRYNFVGRYDMAGQPVHTWSCDSGNARLLNDTLGAPIYAWNARGYRTRTEYDALRRPNAVWVNENGIDRQVSKTEYGEYLADRQAAQANNLLGQAYKQYDQSGVQEVVRYSFKGEPLAGKRRLAADYKHTIDWSDPTAVAQEDEVFATDFTYDALGRPTVSTNADGSRSYPVYHASGRLKGLRVAHPDGQTKEYIEDIAYNAKGQREAVRYGNGTVTTYAYEPTTFRLSAMLSRRSDGTVLQDIAYTYDPVGNIVAIVDRSFQAVYNNNSHVAPKSAYTYDALYQLTEATGREHPGLNPAAHPDGGFDQGAFIPLNPVADGQALSNYRRLYTYDEGANLVRIRHSGAQSFTTDMTISDSSNRGIAMQNNANIDPDSAFDAAGNLIHTPHLRGIEWNFANQLHSATLIERDGQPDDVEYYTYDGAGQRTRKIKETLVNGNVVRIEEKIYLGNVEIIRVRNGATEPSYERHTLHISDGAERTATYHHWVQGLPEGVANNAARYCLGNHQGSAVLETDESGQIIVYEEYFPFGGTAFVLAANQTEVKLREYRYTGKECDGSTGFYYFGARYYMPWQGRWLNPDPAGYVDGLNVYAYVRNNPVGLRDTNGLQSNGGQEQHVVKSEKLPPGVDTVEEVKAHYQEIYKTDKFTVTPDGKGGFNVSGLADDEAVATAAAENLLSGLDEVLAIADTEKITDSIEDYPVFAAGVSSDDLIIAAGENSLISESVDAGLLTILAGEKAEALAKQRREQWFIKNSRPMPPDQRPPFDRNVQQHHKNKRAAAEKRKPVGHKPKSTPRPAKPKPPKPSNFGAWDGLGAGALNIVTGYHSVTDDRTDNNTYGYGKIVEGAAQGLAAATSFFKNFRTVGGNALIAVTGASNIFFGALTAFGSNQSAFNRTLGAANILAGVLILAGLAYGALPVIIGGLALSFAADIALFVSNYG